MRHAPRALFALFVLAVAAMGAAPWRSLPSCLIGKWEGITVTDPNGNIVGSEDASDWGCLGGGTSGRLTKPLDGVPAPPPTATCLFPAAPNPTSGHTTFTFSLVSDSQVSLVLYGKKGNGPHGAYPVKTLVSQELAAGVHSVAWDGTDDQGASLPPDLYRLVLTVGDQSVCGDLQIQ